MDLSKHGMELLCDFEGKHKKQPNGTYKAYRCPANVPTIYAGLTRGVYDGMVVTEAQGEKMLAKELAATEDAVERLTKVPLNQNQFDALVLLVYNIGVGAYQKSTLLKQLNKGNYDAVPAQMMRWVNGGGKKLSGLVRRRRAEAALFMAPVEFNTEPATLDEPDEEAAPNMPQAVTEAKPPVAEVVKQSWTIRGAVAALGGAGVQVYQWALSGATEAGVEATNMKTAFGPWEALFEAMKANMGLIAAGFVLMGCVIVIVRRISDHQEGRS